MDGVSFCPCPSERSGRGSVTLVGLVHVEQRHTGPQLTGTDTQLLF